MTSGAPMIERMAFTGKVLFSKVLLARMSAARVNIPPAMAVVKMFF